MKSCGTLLASLVLFHQIHCSQGEQQHVPAISTSRDLAMLSTQPRSIPTINAPPQPTAPPISKRSWQADKAATEPSSLCGYISYNVHFPWYCPEDTYCVTSAQYMPCCNNVVSTVTYNYTIHHTYTTTLRNSATITSTSSQNLETASFVYGNCSAWGPCYDSTAISNCTGPCTSTAVLCSDPNFPYCASIIAPANSVSAYFCDTEAYDMELYQWGEYPTPTSSSTSTSTTTTSSFVPDIVPYTKHQPLRPQSVLKGAEGGGALRTAVPSATSTSGVNVRFRVSEIAYLWLRLAWVLCAVRLFQPWR